MEVSKMGCREDWKITRWKLLDQLLGISVHLWGHLLREESWTIGPSERQQGLDNGKPVRERPFLNQKKKERFRKVVHDAGRHMKKSQPILLEMFNCHGCFPGGKAMDFIGSEYFPRICYFLYRLSPVTFRIAFDVTCLRPSIYVTYLEQPDVILTRSTSFERREKTQKHLRHNGFIWLLLCMRAADCRKSSIRIPNFDPSLAKGPSFLIDTAGPPTMTLSAIQYNLVVDCLKWSCAGWRCAHSPPSFPIDVSLDVSLFSHVSQHWAKTWPDPLAPQWRIWRQKARSSMDGKKYTIYFSRG